MAIIRYITALDPGGTTGTPCAFGLISNQSSNPSYYQETVNISGAAGAVVTLQVIQPYTITNTSGKVLVNGSQVFLGTVFTITLDASGNGSFIAKVTGDATQTGTIVRCYFSITGVTIGYINTPSTHQISKTF